MIDVLGQLPTKFLHQISGSRAIVPLTDGFRFTENGSEVGLSAARLARAEAFSGIQTYSDPARHQVVSIGLAKVTGANHVFVLRLRIDHEQVSEAEVIFSEDRKGHFSDVEQLAKPDILYRATVPADRASSEDQLLAIANSYWDALQESDGSAVPVAYRCDAFDNGKKITNNLSILLSPDATVHSVQTRIYGTRGARPVVRDRRFPVVDEELGVVVSFAMVDLHTNPSAPRPDNGTFYFAAVFKIVDQEIRMIDEFREILPLGATSGWQHDEERP